ncbi:DUF6476 family protein [uncultured Thioclava sp.]|jgi:hypothetical protein|uniref:DUF6476 family protein n=1 Tax=uncultured Thioclava sp. TaxID=473858 RepID=UPI0025CE233A|nr:DUF6476 family protein [uncultured Thioclava sp.]
MSDLPDDDVPATLPPDLRFLKLLVTVLAGVMILGLVAIVTLLVIRLQTPSPLPQIPSQITLPAGAHPEAVTFARGYTVVVTDQGDVLVYSATGAQLAQVAITGLQDGH